MNSISNRVLEESKYIIKTHSTIRQTAKVFNVSKSTVHKDISYRLRDLNYEKYLLVDEVLKEHIETRHIIGGQSTKQKYEKLRQNRG